MTALPRLRTAAPFAALLAVSASLFGALPQAVAPMFAVHAAPFDVADAEAQACQRRSGRSWDDCVAEIEGKSLIVDAERAQARTEAR